MKNHPLLNIKQSKVLLISALSAILMSVYKLSCPTHMSETSFAANGFALQDTPPPMSLLEIQLRALLLTIRRQAKAALSFERALCIPGIIAEHTPLRVSFDDSDKADTAHIPAAYMTHIDPTSGESLYFMLPKDWTGLVPSGNMSMERAVTLLEKLHHTMLNPTPPLLRYGDQLAPLPGEKLNRYGLGTEEEPTLPAGLFTTLKQ